MIRGETKEESLPGQMKQQARGAILAGGLEVFGIADEELVFRSFKALVPAAGSVGHMKWVRWVHEVGSMKFQFGRARVNAKAPGFRPGPRDAMRDSCDRMYSEASGFRPGPRERQR